MHRLAHPVGHRGLRGVLRPVLLLAVTVAAGVALGAVVVLLDVRVTGAGDRTAVVVAATLAAAALGASAAVLARRSWSRAADVTAVGGAVLLATLSVAALHGTRWGWAGLYADSSFRTQMATRYAETAALVDYGYQDLPAYYPPAVGWLQGRLAAVTGLAGWEAVKPVEIVLAALVPLLAYALWRPVVGALPGAAAATLVAAWAAHLQKPDEWLVLSCLVPWWLLAVRDVRAPGVARWPAWRLGLVLGVLLLVHTYYFLPMGVATLLALGYDAARRRRPSRLPWRRALAIGAVGLLVAAPSWVPAVLARTRLPSDSLQLRYTMAQGNVPPFPLPTSLLGVMGLAGVAWLVWAAWRWWRAGEPDDLAGGLTLALAGAVLTMAAGAVAERHGTGFLAFKSGDLVESLLVTAAVMGAGRWLARWSARRGRSLRATHLVPVVLAALVAGAAAYHLTTTWVTGDPALMAHGTRYPDGTRPDAEQGGAPRTKVLFVEPDDPSVTELRSAWAQLRPDVPLAGAVLVTSQVDFLATTPVHGFVSYKSIYSHPNGQFEDRVALLEEVAACPTPACAADLLRDNPFDRVDGLLLRRDGDDLVLPLMADDFPDRTRYDQVVIPSRVLEGEEFLRRDLGGPGGLALVALRG